MIFLSSKAIPKLIKKKFKSNPNKISLNQKNKNYKNYDNSRFIKKKTKKFLNY